MFLLYSYEFIKDLRTKCEEATAPLSFLLRGEDSALERGNEMDRHRLLLVL